MVWIQCRLAEILYYKFEKVHRKFGITPNSSTEVFMSKLSGMIGPWERREMLPDIFAVLEAAGYIKKALYKSENWGSCGRN